MKPEGTNTTTSDGQDDSGLALPIPKKEKKAAEELAATIHDDLSMIEGCPKRGVNVTVYGLNPWNSILSCRRRFSTLPRRPANCIDAICTAAICAASMDSI
jgi:hypothetical protein